MVKFAKDYFNMVLMIQFILFIFFIGLNSENLTEIPYTISIGTYDFDFTLNLLAIGAVIIGLAALVIIVGINVVESGLNDTSTRNMAVVVGLIALYLIMETASNYFTVYLGDFTDIVNIMLTIGYLFKVFDVFIEENGGE